MSDRSPDWNAPQAAFLEALRAQQRTLEEGWTSWLDAWRRGLQPEGMRSAGAPAARRAEREGARGEPGSSSADAVGGATRTTSLGAIDWYVRAAQDTVEAIGILSRALLGGSVERGEDPAALWRQLAGDPSGGGPRGTGAEGATAIRPDALVRAFGLPWALMSGDGTSIMARWLGMPLWTNPPAATDDEGPSPNAWDNLSRLAGITARQVSFGPIEPELARRSAELSETGLACLGAIQRYEALRLHALVRIAERFVKSLGDDDRGPPDSLRGLFERWIETGDRVLLEMYRTDEYLAAQRELLESLMRYRVRWQALQDLLAQAAGRPTREELDDAYRSIHELRRELRAQRRVQRELLAAVSTGADARRAPSEKKGARQPGGKRDGGHASGVSGGERDTGAKKRAGVRKSGKKSLAPGRAGTEASDEK